MTNKERYKQAFSALRPSVQLSWEAEEMNKIQKRHKVNVAIAAAIICAVVVGGSGTAYAADLGGIREKISMWLYGTQKEVEVTENGNETWLSADEIIADMNEHADIIPDGNGRVWVYYYDQQIDITDQFDDDGICRIALSHDGVTTYLKITSESDGSYAYSQYNEPEEAKELYSPVS